MALTYKGHDGRATAYSNYRQRQHPRDRDPTSLLNDLRAFVVGSLRLLWRFWNERGRRMALAALISAARQVRRNLTYNRLFSFPHLLVAIWVFVLLWGERWVFHSKVESCHWSNWEKWVS